MSPQRLVAALAALAVGFGVTLVGVQIVDDDDDTAVATVEAPESPSTEPEVEPAEEAQQEAAPAEPSPEADVVEDGDDAEGVDDGEAPVASSSGATPPRTGSDERDSTDTAECEAVLVVRTGTGQVLILSGALGEFTESDGRFFLAGSGDSVAERFRAQDIELISGIIDDRSTSRSVQDCETGDVVDATILLDFGSQLPDTAPPNAVGDEVGGVTTAASAEFFPCSDDAFEALFDTLDDLEATELIDDTDIFVRVVAKSLARFGGASVGEWEAQIEEVFDGFVGPEDCVDDLDDLFVRGGSDGFFCASSNVSADSRLFDYLAGVVPDQMAQCADIHGEGVN